MTPADTDLDACAAKVATGDPDRFAAAMTAPLPLRGRLMALYAFNLEVARAPWVATEPMLAEMRLQWWADTVEEIFAGQRPRRHEVVTPLAATITAVGLPRAPFDMLIAARRRDVDPAPHPDMGALLAYLDATGGSLSELAVRALGGGDAAAATGRRFGAAAGAARLIAALPELRVANRPTLPGPDRAAAVRALADHALTEIAACRKARHAVPRGAAPALISDWRADAVLRMAKADPEAALDGLAQPSEFRRRAGFLRAALTGRW